MKIVVIGGSGLIGSKVVTKLSEHGHEVIAASPKTGVNTLTGEGLRETLRGAQIVVDVANSPSFEPAAALEFFEKGGRNLFAAEINAGVKHHVALSVVGTDRLPDIGYFRAKVAQERLIKSAGIPYSIVRATQFFEFIGAIAEAGSKNGAIRMTSAFMQPIAAEDVANALVDVALSPPLYRTIEIAGPEAIQMDMIVRELLTEKVDAREVITDDSAPYFGMVLNKRSLMPGLDARMAPTRFADWLQASIPQTHLAVGS